MTLIEHLKFTMEKIAVDAASDLLFYRRWENGDLLHSHVKDAVVSGEVTPAQIVKWAEAAFRAALEEKLGGSGSTRMQREVEPPSDEPRVKNDFELVLSGETHEELFADFCDQLGFVWREYAQLGEENLTADAKALRSTLRSVFGPTEKDAVRSLNITLKVVGEGD